MKNLKHYLQENKFLALKILRQAILLNKKQKSKFTEAHLEWARKNLIPLNSRELKIKG
jgi:hypothetical protein